MKDQDYFNERLKIGKFNQAGIISLCPVCESGISPTTDEKAQFINENWFHGPCSRFAFLVCAAENCPVCGSNTAVQDGDTVSGRWWMACSVCRLPVARWSNFTVFPLQPAPTVL